MSDDFRNLFDDDSLLPDWLQDSMESLPEETPDDDERAAPAPRRPAGPRPPWEQMRGEAPPPPAGKTAAPPPWESYQGQPPAPPAPSTAAPPWSSAPAGSVSDQPAAWDAPQEDMPAPGDFVDWSGAQRDAAPPVGRDEHRAFDWDAQGEARAPSAPAGEIPRGLTGALPWMSDQGRPGGLEMPSELADLGGFDFDALETDEDSAPDFDSFGPEDEDSLAPTADPYGGRSMADRAGLRDESFTFDSLADEFESEAVEEAPPPVLPSLRDRLQAMAPGPEDAAWMASFGEAATYDMNAPDDAGSEDMEWLQAPAEEPPAAPSDSGIELDEDIEALFQAADYSAMPATKAEESPDDVSDWPDDVFEEPEPPPSPIRRLAPTPPPEPEEEVEEVVEEALDWLDDALEEFGDEPEPEPPAAPPGPIRRLAPTPPPPAAGQPPSPIRRLAPTPPAEEPPPSPIRRLAPTPPPQDEEPGDESLPSWLHQADEIPDDSAPDTGGLTYEEWERREIERAREEAKTPEDRLVEQVPEWFDKDADALPLPDEFAAPEKPGGEGPEGQGPEFVPGWFLGLDEPEAGAEDAPEWFKNLDYTADPLAAPPTAPETPPPPPDETPDELPDWFKGSTDELSGIDWDKTFGAGAASEEPPQAAVPPEEPPLPEPDLEALFDTGEPAPGGVPDWLAAAAPVEAENAEPDLEALFDTGEPTPGGMPDWLAAAAPVEAEGAMPDLEALFDAGDAESAMPDLEALFDAGEAEPGEAVIARAEDVPFPDLDLDQTMPDNDDDIDKWMTEFRPDSRPGALPLRTPQDESGEDFVERFDPLAPDEYSGRTGGVDDTPDWLREMAAEGESGAAEDEALPLPVDVFGGADRADELDWLRDISAEDLVEPRDEAPEFPLPDRAIPTPDEGVISDEELDSQAIDRLLSLYGPEDGEVPDEPAGEQVPASAEFDWAPGDWEPAPPAEESEESPLPFGEIYGVPTEPEPGDEEDLAALLATSESADALPGVDDLFPAQAEDSPPPRRPAPSAKPVFKEPFPAEEAPAAAAEPSQPGWVTELRPADLPVTVKAGAAEISIKQRQVAELPDRLRALHDLTSQMLEGEKTETPPESGALQGLAGLVPVADLEIAREAVPVEGLIITPEQELRLDRLQAMLDLVAAEEEEVQEQHALLQGAEEFSYGEGAEAAPLPQRARRPVRYKADRLLIAVLVLAALVAPFVTDALHFAGDPPALGGEQQGVAGVIDTLEAGDYVLFAFEYGPTAAGELDGLSEAVLRDVLAHNAIPLTISTNPAGAFHAQAVLDPLNDDPKLLAVRGQGETALAKGEDYVTLSYLPGDAVGVRTLRSRKVDSEGKLQVLPAFQRDLRGDESGLSVGDLSTDIALIVVAGEDTGAVRTWAEQLSDVPVPKIALVTAAIEPLTAPYADGKGYAGYLAGVRDTYRYNQDRNAASRTPYTLPDGAPDSIPDPEEARWHSMALGAAVAAGLIALGTSVNLLRALGRRRRR